MGYLAGGHAVHPIEQGLSWPRGGGRMPGGCASLLASFHLPPPPRLPLCGFLLSEAGCLQGGSAGTAGRQAAEVGEGALGKQACERAVFWAGRVRGHSLHLAS